MEKSDQNRLVNLIQKSKVDQALEMLLQFKIRREYRFALVSLSRQWHHLKLEIIKGVIPAEERRLLQNQITDRLLTLVDMIYADQQDDSIWEQVVEWFWGAKQSVGGGRKIWVFFWSEGKPIWKQRATLLVTLLSISGGFLVAGHWPSSRWQVLSLDGLPEPESWQTYEAHVTDSAGQPLANLTAKLVSGHMAPTKTDRDGHLKFQGFVCAADRNDTVHLYQGPSRLATRAIRFPGRGEIVVGGRYEVNLWANTGEPKDPIIAPPPTWVLADTSMVLEGEIYVDSDSIGTDQHPPCVPNIHIQLFPKGAKKPSAEVTTDAKGHYRFEIRKGDPLPFHIRIEDPAGRYESVEERFLRNRPTFDYSLKKK